MVIFCPNKNSRELCHAHLRRGWVPLLAVLWFDLMFDVQTRKYPVGPLPPKVLASIWRKTARLCLAFGHLNRA